MTTKADRIYEQQSAEFRSLNGFFWQIPLIMMTLNGGLWFSVASLELGVGIQRPVLWFAALANVIVIFALFRLRDIMGALLTKIHGYEGGPLVARDRVIIWLFAALLGAAAAGALMASADPSAHFKKKPEAKPATCVLKLPNSSTPPAQPPCRPGPVP